MGNNCEAATKGHKEFLKNGNNATPKFRVYIHRRTRVIHAWLIILPDTIQLELETNSKGKVSVTSWPLNLIRRYGYTSAGIFFFESGRRCPTGEGFHCFQTQYADAVFRLVQQRVHSSMGSDQTSSGANERRSLGPETKNEADHCKVNLLQRFPSEGNSVLGDYRPPSGTGGSWSPTSAASAYKRRNVILPPAPRPRSVSDMDDSHRGMFLQRNTVGDKVVGNIISMSHNPSASDDSSELNPFPEDTYAGRLPRANDGVIPSYVNISPNGDLAFKFTRTRTGSSSSLGSMPSSPASTISKVFSMKWDAGGGSTSLLCHVPQPSSGDYANDLYPTGDNTSNAYANYVNVQTGSCRSAATRETTPILNYVDVQPDSPANTLTKSRRNDCRLPPNYTLIDADKTKALHAVVMERSTPGRNRSPR